MKALTLLLAFVFSFAAMTPKAAANPNKMVAVILLAEDDDKTTVTTIFTTLMAAEKVSKLMGIEMTASDDPIADDVYVFALKSQEQKQLTLKMFDEEGYQLAAHRVMQIEEGNTYRSMNMESLEDGTYKFQLIDEEGNEMERNVTIKRKD